MPTTLLILSILLVFFSFLSFFNWRMWVIYGLRAQRFQIGILLILLLISFPFFKTSNPWIDYPLFILMCSAIVFDFYRIFPFTRFAKCELPAASKEDNVLSLLTSNVRMSNDDCEGLLQQIKEIQPDIILLTEVDQGWIEKVSVLEKEYLHRCLQAQDNTYGIALYSKYPLQDKKIEFLVDDKIPSIHCTIKMKEDQFIQFLGLHPRPPAPWTKEENKDMELIIAAARTNENRYPSIVSGDLNDVAWSPATRQFKAVSGLIDPRVGRGFFNTYNAFIPFFRIPIDHFFVSRHFKLITMKRLKKFGSDHFPIYIKFNIEEKQK